MLSAKFFGSSSSNTTSSYNKNFVQSGLSNGGNSPWIYQTTGSSIFITTSTPYPIILTSPITTGSLTVNGDSSISGNLTVSGNITTLSDRKSKKNIKNITNHKINLLNYLIPVEYEYKKSDGNKHFGFIAQDVQSLYPNLVINYDGLNTVNYIELIPLLVGKINNLEKNIFFNKLIICGFFIFTAIHAHKLIHFPMFSTV
jgi:hypothetical protein